MPSVTRCQFPVTRRSFLGGGLTASASALGFDLAPTVAHARETAKALRRLRITTTICPYCSVGCGALVMSEMRDGMSVAVSVEGDPEHPINAGRLCPEGASLYHLANNENRLRKVLYRAPGAAAFVERDWDWAIREIARRIKSTRDASFTPTNANGQVVNRTTAIASVGSAALDNEECWLLQKLLRSLGLVYIEHQARICHSSTVVALAASFGRGAMTNHWIDIANSGCVLLMGANPAECHPISMHWVLTAKKRGATVIVRRSSPLPSARFAHIQNLPVPLVRKRLNHDG